MKERVVLVDDHIGIREMLACVLRREVDYEVAGEATTGIEAWQVCRELKPRLVILDLVLPELSGAELTRRLRASLPDVRVLIYSGTFDRKHIEHALAARPHGLIQKSDPLNILREAIRAVARGGAYFTPFASTMLDRRKQLLPGNNVLTAREREILQLVAESCTSKEIAARLAISAKTVENHRQRLMEKLRLRDVAALTRYAVRTGIVDTSH